MKPRDTIAISTPIDSRDTLPNSTPNEFLIDLCMILDYFEDQSDEYFVPTMVPENSGDFKKNM